MEGVRRIPELCTRRLCSSENERCDVRMPDQNVRDRRSLYVDRGRGTM